MKESKRDFEKEINEKKETTEKKKESAESKIQYIHPTFKTGKIFVEVGKENYGFDIIDGVFQVPKNSPAISKLEKENFKTK